MLKDYQFVKNSLSKEERKDAIKSLIQKLADQQLLISKVKLPVVVVVDGWDAAGKGGLIRQIASGLDARFASFFSCDRTLKEADRYPFLYPYEKALPEAGKILLMDGSWMGRTVRDRIDHDLDEEAYLRRLSEVNDFERTLRDNGYYIIKLFVHISEKEQKKRMGELKKDQDTSWRVRTEDLWQNRKYDRFLGIYDNFIESNQGSFSWHILNGMKRNRLCLEALEIITNALDFAIEAGCIDGAPVEKEFLMADTPRLEDTDLTLSITKEEYDEQLAYYQAKLEHLHNAIYRKRIPMVLGFEGWDAAGKGGAIRRLTQSLDPRGLDVFPISSPEPHEKARHYLWRFWTKMPRSGHIAVFDRTWYGRVLVERIEGFCTENSWRRAYTEINEFEKRLSDSGAVVLKFWLHIDSETQLERFTIRQNTPEKQWKITGEDWRNREKWADYEKAVSEMIEKTSTVYAPWHIIEAVDKRYARIKVLRIVTEAMEKALEEVDREEAE